ncbi:MAG: carbohydrate binding family 9 domain-containing protein [Calditrichae bacterium]|nr:carbohydrate binding family 9 domain-containing protein [Calditrichia bacterium]
MLIAYDKQYLYLAFIAEDDPATIRSSLRDRDEMFNDDFVGILIDTYGDAASAYEIFVNPIGVQGDLRLTASNEDGSFDMIYQSQGKITENGFQVEVAIPFSSLRFPDKPQQEWRVNFWRNHPATAAGAIPGRISAATIPASYASGARWSVSRMSNRVTTWSCFLRLSVLNMAGCEDSDDPNSTFNNESVQAEPSLGMRYAFTPSISAEATINPDFSQVESDAAQVDVNTNFALFFPERRPSSRKAVICMTPGSIRFTPAPSTILSLPAS